MTDSVTTKVSVVLPKPPNRANARQHWATTYREKKAYYEECGKWMAAFNLHARRAPRWGSVRWLAMFGVKQLYDPDNLAALCKWPLDFLVTIGLFPGDDQIRAWPDGWPEQRLTKKQEQVVITFWEWKRDAKPGEG